jgi:hypothetical protein
MYLLLIFSFIPSLTTTVQQTENRKGPNILHNKELATMMKKPKRAKTRYTYSFGKQMNSS